MSIQKLHHPKLNALRFSAGTWTLRPTFLTGGGTRYSINSLRLMPSTNFLNLVKVLGKPLVQMAVVLRCINIATVLRMIKSKSFGQVAQ